MAVVGDCLATAPQDDDQSGHLAQIAPERAVSQSRRARSRDLVPNMALGRGKDVDSMPLSNGSGTAQAGYGKFAVAAFQRLQLLLPSLDESWAWSPLFSATRREFPVRHYATQGEPQESQFEQQQADPVYERLRSSIWCSPLRIRISPLGTPSPYSISPSLRNLFRR